MFLVIADVLNPELLESVRKDLSLIRWEDGAKTAGPTAQSVKQNQQADLSSRAGKRLRDRLTSAMQDHPVLRAAAQPARFSDCLISRTSSGGGYGTHIDNPFMGFGDKAMRTDLSYTLFLSDPDTHSGGELTVVEASGTRQFKPDAGSLMLYPTRFLHRVEPVTDGERIACVGWIESRIRRETDREILFDLENLMATLSVSHDPQSPECLTLAKLTANLKRRFS